MTVSCGLCRCVAILILRFPEHDREPLRWEGIGGVTIGALHDGLHLAPVLVVAAQRRQRDLRFFRRIRIAMICSS